MTDQEKDEPGIDELLERLSRVRDLITRYGEAIAFLETRVKELEAALTRLHQMDDPDPFPCPICQGTEWKVETQPFSLHYRWRQYPVEGLEHSECQNPACRYDLVLPHQSRANEEKIRAVLKKAEGGE